MAASVFTFHDRKDKTMGYGIYLQDHIFRMKKEHFAEAFAAVKTAFPEGWTRNLRSFTEAMEDMGYHPYFDDDGNIQEFVYIGDRLHGDYEFWSAVAPYVETDSYIEFEGDDFERWRWVFKAGKLKVIYPTILWIDDEEPGDQDG